jgi:hypothetical protein
VKKKVSNSSLPWRSWLSYPGVCYTPTGKLRKRSALYREAKAACMRAAKKQQNSIIVD